MGPVSRLCPEVHARTAGQIRTEGDTTDTVPAAVPGQAPLGASARDTAGTPHPVRPRRRHRARRGFPPGPGLRARRQPIAPTFFLPVTIFPVISRLSLQVVPVAAFEQSSVTVKGESFENSNGLSLRCVS